MQYVALLHTVLLVAVILVTLFVGRSLDSDGFFMQHRKSVA